MRRRDWRGGRSQPPWWPVNEPWPPQGGPRSWRGGRARFARRAGCFFTVVLFLSVIGAATVVSWLTAARGQYGQPLRFPAIPIGVLIVIFAIGLVRVLIRRFGTPLGDIVEASNRVAAGDFAVRLSEQGPLSVRTVARAFNSMTTRLEAQDSQRRHLMADVAHELRNPLAVVQGRLEGMLDGVYPRDEAQISAVLEETRMLTRLVDDLRTLAHAESGMLALQKEPTDLGMLLNESVASFAVDSRGGQAPVSVDAPPDLPLIEIDPLRIREVVTNLVSNAVRHTPPSGAVSIEAVRRGDVIEVKVRDNGAGIAAEEVPKIFNRFYKGRGSRGSGLGLTIARNLVVAHGGEIRAESQAGQGTTIIFTLPVA